MSKKICFMDIKVDEQHTTTHDVYKKNLYAFSRLISCTYDYGTYNNKFISSNKNTLIAKQRCAYFSDENDRKLSCDGKDIEQILYDLKKILSEIEILVIFNTEHQLKCLIAEFIKYNISFNLKNIVLIDLQSFNNDYKSSTIKKLSKKLQINDENNIELIKNCFFKLYNNIKT